MTVQQMIEKVQEITHHNDESRVVSALDAAQSWAYARVYNAEGGADLLITFDEELTILTPSREYDLQANLSFEMVGLKTLWLKLIGETAFTVMMPLDASDPQFRFRDTLDVTQTFHGHPTYYEVKNFTQLRFTQELPTGAILRVDYFRFPPPLDPTTNNTQTNGSDLPVVTHWAMIDYACAEIWDILDDNRSAGRMMRAESRLTDALYLIRNRSAAPTRTLPFRTRRRRYI